MLEITNNQIDAIYDRNSKFTARQCYEKGVLNGYEVVEMMNTDWKDTITDEQERRGKFATYDEAEKFQRQLHVRYVLKNT